MTRFKTWISTAAALTVLFGAWVSAQEDEKQSPPEGGTPKDFTLPAKDTFELPNGLRVTMVQIGSVPKATVRIVVRSGNLNEGDQTWLADLSGDFLLEGTARRNAEDIAREAAAMGGQVTVSVTEDRTTISGDALSDFVPKMAALLADVARNPEFPASELERLKRDRLRQLSVAQTRPQQMALAAFRKAMYGDHPYGRVLPDEDQLAGYTLDDARNFYLDNFGAQRTHVFVAGMFDAAITRAALEKAFDDWERGPVILLNVPEPVEGKVVVDVIDRPGAVQSNVYLGLPTLDPSSEDWIALQISNTLLGGFFSSRITRNIREDKGYTYSPRSAVSTRYRDAYWVQTAAVTTDVTGLAIQEILYEIDNLANNPPPADELDGVKNYAAGVFVLQNSTRSGIINVLSYLDLHELPESYLTNYVSDVFALTPEQISETVSKYIREEDMTLVVVGDRGQVSEQVADWIGTAAE